MSRSQHDMIRDQNSVSETNIRVLLWRCQHNANRLMRLNIHLLRFHIIKSADRTPRISYFIKLLQPPQLSIEHFRSPLLYLLLEHRNELFSYQSPPVGSDLFPIFFKDNSSFVNPYQSHRSVFFDQQHWSPTMPWKWRITIYNFSSLLISF